MPEIHPIIKKLQYKDLGQPVLMLNAPQAYQEVMLPPGRCSYGARASTLRFRAGLWDKQ